MSHTYLIHLDTSSASNVTGTTTFNGTTTYGEPSVYKVNGNPFQCTVILGNRHRRIRSVTLKNAQIPIGYYSIRAPFNTLTITSNTYTVTPGNYQTVPSLISALNAAAGASVGTFSNALATNLMTFNAGVYGSATMNVAPQSLLSFLGFTNGQSGTSIVAKNCFLTNFDPYINIWIENLGQSSLEPSQITFKVPVNVPNGSVLQWAELSQFKQCVPVTDRSVRLDRLNITVLDRFGNVLNNNGLDWAFTLEIEADT
jgi:hypothetical protein